MLMIAIPLRVSVLGEALLFARWNSASFLREKDAKIKYWSQHRSWLQESERWQLCNESSAGQKAVCQTPKFSSPLAARRRGVRCVSPPPNRIEKKKFSNVRDCSRLFVCVRTLHEILWQIWTSTFTYNFFAPIFSLPFSIVKLKCCHLLIALFLMRWIRPRA